MEIKLLSDLIPANILEKAEWYSYFLIYCNEFGERELLPADNHAAAFPLKLDRDNQVTKGEVNFFNQYFFNGFTDKEIKVSRVEDYNYLPKNHTKCILINLLDNCYGHSLLKLFNVCLFYSKYSNEYDIYIISPASFRAFLPDDKINIIYIRNSFAEIAEGYSLRPITQELKSKYDNVDYAFLNTYQAYDSEDVQFSFLNLFENGIINKKCIIFYYRKEKKRRWGFNQKKKISDYFIFLNKYFHHVEYILIGEKDNSHFPPFVKDYRCDSFTSIVEKDYCVLLKESIFVAGVHGSHMILPSLLSRQVFHIVPGMKIKNTAEDVYNRKEPRISGIYHDVNIFPSGKWKQRSGKRMGEITLFLYLASLEKEYKNSLHTMSMVMSQAEFVKMKFPYFNYSLAIQYWNKREAFELRVKKYLQ